MSGAATPIRVAVLGSTGSIGRKALEVLARHPDRFTLTALAAGSSVEALRQQAEEYRPRVAVLADAGRAEGLRGTAPEGVEIGEGAAAMAALAAREDVDLVVNGVVGRAGLESSLVAAGAGKRLALANKESLVLAGELLMRTAGRSGASIIPVDSEHSGLFQALQGRRTEEVRRLIITASGGPFRGRGLESLGNVTPAEALNHPVWPMGPRITVDSATLFNKGLEVIETHFLFGTPLDRIHVWVHPQSIVHALVELVDGALIAQLSTPDMLMPVQYAMTWPERLDCGAPSCDLAALGRLTFEEPDRTAFPALDLAYQAARHGGTAPAVLNAADEVAVEAFLEGALPFLDITEVIMRVLEATPIGPADSLEAISAADREARERARAAVEALTG